MRILSEQSMLLAAEKREDRECWDLQLPIKEPSKMQGIWNSIWLGSMGFTDMRMTVCHFCVASFYKWKNLSRNIQGKQISHWTLLQQEIAYILILILSFTPSIFTSVISNWLIVFINLIRSLYSSFVMKSLFAFLLWSQYWWPHRKLPASYWWPPLPPSDLTK